MAATFLHQEWKQYVVANNEDGVTWIIRCPYQQCKDEHSSGVSHTATNPDRAFFSCNECGVFGWLNEKAPSAPSKKSAAKAAEKKRAREQQFGGDAGGFGGASDQPPTKDVRLDDPAVQQSQAQQLLNEISRVENAIKSLETTKAGLQNMYKQTVGQ